MRILLRQGDTMLADLSFEEETVRAGSAGDSEVHLPSAKLADYHLRLSPFRPGVWAVETVSKKPIPTLNGLPMSTRANVKDGDRISVAGYTLTVYPTWGAGREDADVDAALRGKPLPAGTLIRKHMEKIAIPAGWLDKISRIAMELGLCTDLRILLDYSLDMMLRVFGAGYAWIGCRRKPEGRLEFVEGRLDSGKISDTPAFTDALVHHCLTRSQHLCVPTADDPVIVTGMAAPLMSSEGSIGVIYVDSRKKGQSYKPHHLDLFSLIGSLICSRLEQIFQGQLALQTQLAGGEVTLTREVQARLDPKSVPHSEHLQIVAHSKPGSTASGDVFDIVKMASGTIAFFFGHVNADGFETAITMAETRAAFRVAMLHGDAPHVFLRALNWLIHDVKGEASIDCICMLIDAGQGAIKYSAGGRTLARVIGASGNAIPLTGEDRPAVGATASADYQSASAKLLSGAAIALLSPGMAAAKNAAGESLDPQRFIDSLCDGFGQSARASLDDALDDVAAYLRAGEQPEDITVFLVRRT